MPQRADAPQTPQVDIDPDQKYVVELVGLDEQPSQFENSREGDMSMIWKFRVYDSTGAAVLDEINNTPYELWNFTSDRTYFNPKTGKRAKAREWTEALVGRDLSDDEMNELIDLGFADSLMGKRGIADLEWYTTKQGNERLRIIRLRPYRKPKNEEPAAVGAGAGTSNGRSRDDRRKALGLDEE